MVWCVVRVQGSWEQNEENKCGEERERFCVCACVHVRTLAHAGRYAVRISVNLAAHSNIVRADK
jgi:hypothetical protein